MPKIIKVNATYYFIMKTSNKRELQQIKSNNLSSINFKEFTKIYKKNTEKIMNTTIFIFSVPYDFFIK